MGCGSSEILNNGLNHGLSLSFFKFFGITFYFGLKFQNQNLDCYNVLDPFFFLDLQANLPEASPNDS